MRGVRVDSLRMAKPPEQGLRQEKEEGGICFPHSKSGRPKNRKGRNRRRSNTKDDRAKKAEEKVAAIEKPQAEGHSRPVSLGDWLLSVKIYKESVGDFKYPATLPTCRGSKDSQDPRNFMAGFVKRLRLLGAMDAMLCRVFTTCLTGEAWDWYMGLARGSIDRFDDLKRAFLTRYALIRPPQVTCEMLFDIVQGPREGTRSFITRFMETTRKIQNLNEEIAAGR